MKHLITLALLFTMLAGWSSSLPNRNPTGEVFPSVTGEDLNKKVVRLPEDLRGTPALLLVGYVQKTQFDLDRWAVGLLQAGFPHPIVEVPTIPGLVPSLIKNTIDDGMRSGIPQEDWHAVVTLYGDAADPVSKLTGTTGPRNGRILLLDAQGKVAWFWDQGFSARRLLEVVKLAQSMPAPAGQDPKPEADASIKPQDKAGAQSE